MLFLGYKFSIWVLATSDQTAHSNHVSHFKQKRSFIHGAIEDQLLSSIELKQCHQGPILILTSALLTWHWLHIQPPKDAGCPCHLPSLPTTQEDRPYVCPGARKGLPIPVDSLPLQLVPEAAPGGWQSVRKLTRHKSPPTAGVSTIYHLMD